MSKIYVVWASDSAKANARKEEICADYNCSLIKEGRADRVQAEDLDAPPESLTSDGPSYYVVFEIN